ncbi:serine/threonine protein kinase [Sphaerisporangium album]|uniref:non-specific serine/threonine protein kinase n=2 Tax=Sphaerisporangium album TaxID=509200 RepID=A0A367F157_9ACTN|nr:serine/threonine protein kinase [Sphaerisporangium album]
MGTVYLGEDESGQRVAVKVINGEYSQHEQFRVRFRREAESARRVRRFCTAAVLDADLDGDLLYVVTEYVEGPNLDHAVRSSGPLRGSSLDALAVGVATALTAIHSAGIVHRDLKPSNVLLSPVGPRVIDFGIARALDTLGGVTGTGELMGTPRYMAPEVLRGEPASPACDVFSWGCLVAFAASGRAPFGGESLPSIVYQVLNTEPSLEGMEPSLHRLVSATLDKDPSRRPTAQQILDQMVGRTTPEHAEHSVVQAWRQSPPPGTTSPVTSRAPGTPATAGVPSSTIHGSPATPYSLTSQGPPPTAQGHQAGGTATWHGTPPPTVSRHSTAALTSPGGGAGAGHSPPGGTVSGGASADPAARRKRTIGIAVAAVVVIAGLGLGLRALLSPSGPPSELNYYLFREDFSQSGTGWDGSDYTGDDSGWYGYAPNGFYAIDLTGDHTERIENAPIPFVPRQPATPDPSASPTPTTPERLLITVTATVRQSDGTGEYGLFCRSDTESSPNRYEFLVTATGEARVRRVTKGVGGNLTQPVAVADLKKNTPAKLQAECSTTPGGVQLTMWVDGEQVQSYLDPNGLPNGDIGLLTRVPEKTDSTLNTSYDDFTVQGPASPSTTH